MNAKQLIITIAMLGIYAAHGAAGDPQIALVTSSKPNKHNFIGIAATNGSCILLTPDQIKPGKNFPITMVYTQSPELQNQETLAKFTAPFAAIKHEFSKSRFDAALLQAIRECKIKTKLPTMSQFHKTQIENAQQKIDLVRQSAEVSDDNETRERCNIEQQKLDEARRLIKEQYIDRESASPTKVDLHAIILFATLSETGLHSFQSGSRYEIKFGKIQYSSFERPRVEPLIEPYHNEKSNEDMKYVYWEAHCHQQSVSDKDLPCSPQEFAENYARRTRHSEYSLVINMAEFRKRLAVATGSEPAEKQSETN